MEPISTNLNTEQKQPSFDWTTGTIGEALDRIESLIGRIGMNSSGQALAILTGLDAVSRRIQQMNSPQAQQPLQVQFDAHLARMHNEAGTFLRDLGGRTALEELRAAHSPPEENRWWYLDAWLAQRRKASFRRSLLTLGAIALGVVLLAVIYQLFLSPDPEVVARLAHEQKADDALMAGDLDTALTEIEQGLAYSPQDLDLLTLKGVALQATGKLEEAETIFDLAAQAAASREEFLLTRGHAFIRAGMLDAALADSQTILAENPQSAQGYFLSGQIYEFMQDYGTALDHFDRAARLADEQDMPEITAVARTRMAYLMQVMNSPVLPDITVTP